MIDHDIGGRIRHAREQHGLTLEDTARLTKLSFIVLRAIERNDFASLPEGLYRRAYLRTLAAEVGLDPDEIAADYQALHETPADPPPIAGHDSPLRDRWIDELAPPPRGSLVTLAFLAALAAAWFSLQPGPAPPAGVAVEAIADAPAAVLTPAEDERIVTMPQTGDTDTRVATISERSGALLRIEMAAADWCWVAAESDGERVLYRLLAPGEEVMLEGRRMIALRLGNAGSVTIAINDGERRSAGRVGEVVDIVVTPDNVGALRNAAAATA